MWSAFGVEFVVAPASTLAAIAFIGVGVGIGTLSGLIPGLHVNALAMVVALVAPTIPGPPHLVGATMLAAGVTHSFLDIVPSLALGVPDAAMAATALPGHRLVLGGRGREALRLSALGSSGAVLLALVLAWPTTKVMTVVYPVLRAHLPVVLGLVVFVLVLQEPTTRARLGGLAAVGASGLLGFEILDATPVGVLPVSEVLMPAFSGLFGVPILVTALAGGGVPAQTDARLGIDRRAIAHATTAGAGAGGIVGYLPGVSSAIAAVMALTAIPGRAGDRGFIVAVSGVNTSNTIFALFALVTLGNPRTGVLVAYERASLPLDLPLLLASIVIAGALATVLVVVVGDHALAVVHHIDTTRLVLGVLALLVVLALGFAGGYGLLVLLAATAIGFIPPVSRARRVHLMGVLMVPLATGL